MKGFFSTRRICRAGVIAALYVALTYAFSPFAFGPFQIRPAEALCILPLFFPEAVPALYIGCMLSNFASPFFIYDVFLGSLVTLIAALGTYLVGRFIKKRGWGFAIGALFPILLNAIFLPLVIVFLCGDTAGYNNGVLAYWFFFGSMLLTQTLWVGAGGWFLFDSVTKLQKRGVAFFI